MESLPLLSLVKDFWSVNFDFWVDFCVRKLAIDSNQGRALVPRVACLPGIVHPSSIAFRPSPTSPCWMGERAPKLDFLRVQLPVNGPP